ncbi:hypothetical protein PybrP1_007001 [[Pythium] brassicae (nom. inval.)]|nr:hypothetical protein PybrP1_007001 [[Pythium] brassicae (nom. inval.)]
MRASRLPALEESDDKVAADRGDKVPVDATPAEADCVRAAQASGAGERCRAGIKYTYAIAVFEPLLDRLSQLSSVQYYQQLASWKEVVTNALTSLGAPGAGSAHGERSEPTTQDDTDLESVMDPVDTFRTLDAVSGAWLHEHSDGVFDSYFPASQVDFLDLELSEASQVLLFEQEGGGAKKGVQLPESAVPPPAECKT